MFSVEDFYQYILYTVPYKYVWYVEASIGRVLQIVDKF